MKSDPKNTFWPCFLTKDWDSVSGLVFLPKTDTTNVRLHSQWKSLLGHWIQPQRIWQKGCNLFFLLTSENPTTVFHPLVTSILDYLNALCSGLWLETSQKHQLLVENASVVWLLTGIGWRDWSGSAEKNMCYMIPFVRDFKSDKTNLLWQKASPAWAWGLAGEGLQRGRRAFWKVT